jgi:endonuclease/exonuclease/phosphatase family metal-dependent hydrolase
MALPGLTPYLALGALVPLGLCLALRHWLAATAALVVLAGLVALVAPRAVGQPDPARGPALQVLTANLAEGAADPAAVVNLVRDHRVDVLALSELTGPELDALDAAGLGRLLPYSVRNPAGYASGTGLFSRYPLTDRRRIPLTATFVESAAVVHPAGSRPVEVTVVHYCAPADPFQVPCWRYGREHIPPAQPDGQLRLLLGDFNMTVDYAGLRAVLATGYRDAASVAGQGLAATWPYDGTPLPPMAIDHVLADRRIGVSAVAVYGIRDSDHRAVFATLTVPPR